MIYLDNAASTQCLDTAWDAMQDAAREYSNIHRGLHAYAVKTTDRYERARRQVASFIQAKPEEVIFTSGATASLNMVARSWGDRHVGPGDEILVTAMEHHSNLIPWQQLAKRTGAKLCVLHLFQAGRFSIPLSQEAIAAQIRHGITKIIAFPAVSNVLGCVNPVGLITTLAHRADAVVVVDAAQSIPHIPHQCKNIDFLAFSGHKMHGPTGVGVLYVREDRLAEMEPCIFGGGIVQDASIQDYVPGHRKLEAGTPPILQAIGLGAACDYWQRIGCHAIHRHVKRLTRYAYNRLHAHQRVTILGPVNPRCAILSFTVDGIHPHDLAHGLAEHEIAVRAGTHCAIPLHKALEIPASTRISLSYFNQEDEIDRFMEVFNHILAAW